MQSGINYLFQSIHKLAMGHFCWILFFIDSYVINDTFNHSYKFEVNENILVQVCKAFNNEQI